MIVLVTCRLCGESFDAAREDLERGPEYWQFCPVCREDPDRGRKAKTKEQAA